MNRSKSNFVIGAVMTTLISAVVGIGVMMKYVLLSGAAQWEKFGRNVKLTFWGMDRHEWGSIHLLLGVALIVLVVIHIILHWGALVSIFRQLVNSSVPRRAIALIFVLICLFLIVFPMLIEPDMAEGGRHEGRGWRSHQIQGGIDGDQSFGSGMH